VEALFAFSHNTEILREIAFRKAEVEQHKAEIVQAMQAERASEVASSAAARDAEIHAARERRKRSLRAVAAALQASSATLQSHSAGYTSGTTTANVCSSDYGCGPGYACVKPNFSSTGTCMRAVNADGLPAYGPRIESVNVKVPQSTDCRSAADCPALFHCDLASGACLR
jgi:hypothetical protein